MNWNFQNHSKKPERVIVHELAQKFGLAHFSRGGSKHRFLTVSKELQERKDEWQYNSYIGLFGPKVDESATKGIEIVPESMIEKRKKRDGPIHHITLLSREEVDNLIQTIESFKEKFKQKCHQIQNSQSPKELILNVISQVVEDDWKDLGIGKVEEKDDVVYFKVLEWNSAAEFRQICSLPKKDFHITLGFSRQDLHDISKDATKLIQS